MEWSLVIYIYYIHTHKLNFSFSESLLQSCLDLPYWLFQIRYFLPISILRITGTRFQRPSMSYSCLAFYFSFTVSSTLQSTALWTPSFGKMQRSCAAFAFSMMTGVPIHLLHQAAREMVNKQRLAIFELLEDCTSDTKSFPKDMKK